MRLPLAGACMALLACAHGTTTTPEQRARMQQHAVQAQVSAPTGARISGRHGPGACLQRWAYKSEAKFEICLADWERTEQQHVMHGSRAAHIFHGVAAAAAAMQVRRVVCWDHSVSPTCTVDGPLQGCCSYHGGILRDAAGYPVFVVVE